MKDIIYIEYDFEVSPLEPGRDILLAELSLLPFDSFTETEKGLKAYALKDELDKSFLDEINILGNDDFKIKFTSEEIKQENWNAQWESGFQPILVDDRVYVRAPFHPESEAEIDLIIEPKMSFGTGHHETTHMMIDQMLQLDLRGKTVLDMGCGTGVLAILAEKLGAGDIIAVDIDPWCIENSEENLKLNNCSNIKVLLGESDLISGHKFDVILANINRNILLDQLDKYDTALNKNGSICLSGFYRNDLTIIQERCESLHLKKSRILEKNDWVSIVFES